MRKVLIIISAFIVLAGSSLWAQGGHCCGASSGQSVIVVARPAFWLQAQTAAPGPLTEKEVIAGLKSKTPERVVGQVSERGVDFDLTPEIEKRLRKAKADDALVDIIRKAGPTARAEGAKQGGAAAGPKITPEEFQGLRTIQNELDPDKVIPMVADFEKKFPNSSVLTWVYVFAANAYQQKNDIQNAVLYAEKSIKIKDDNIATLLLLATRIPSPQFLRAHEEDKEKYLNEAETCAQRALKLLPDPAVVPKQPNESDAQYAKRKDVAASEAHASLGMVHLQRSRLGLTGIDKGELATSEKEYQQAVTMTDQPAAEDYFRLGEAYAMDGKVDEAIEAFTKASDLGLKTYADQRIEELKKKKVQATPPAKP
jgi:tetratricopeptide (TPR) repeat protein